MIYYSKSHLKPKHQIKSYKLKLSRKEIYTFTLNR